MKVLTIIGARPQFIKAAPMSKEISGREGVTEVIVHTGQHFDENMSDIFFREMHIPTPNYQLNINSLGHGAMTGRMLEEIEKILLIEKPNIVLVYGDTNSTLAGALAAKKLHIKVAHVEAGLRSFNIRMPEEVNRILTDRISDFLFCPTDSAIQNLHNEGFDKLNCSVVRTGDIMYDALKFFSQYAPDASYAFETAGNEKYALCTIHRAENTDDPIRLRNIISTLNKISEEVQILLPLHPRTQKLLQSLSIEPKFNIISPVGYLSMLTLLEHCQFVLTDSGGLQKEAYLKKKYCITMRDETEWVELVENGVNFVVGADSENIYSTFKLIYTKPFQAIEGIYGNGNAAKEIVDKILE